MKIHLMDGSTVEVALDVKEKNALKKGKWLNKDRIWTLIFWFGISFGLAFADFFKFTLGASKASLFINWGTLLGVSILVTLANRTRFIEKDTFANSEGKLINETQMPHWFFLPLVLGIGLTLFVLPRPQYGEFIFFESFIFWSLCFSGLGLYFIFKNCPISILFNHKFHNLEAAKKPKFSSNDDYYARSRRRSDDFYQRNYSQLYSYLPQNIYHRHL